MGLRVCNQPASHSRMFQESQLYGLGQQVSLFAPARESIQPRSEQTSTESFEKELTRSAQMYQQAAL